jgi:hypothetical protein
LVEHATVEVSWKSRGPWFNSGWRDFFLIIFLGDLYLFSAKSFKLRAFGPQINYYSNCVHLLLVCKFFLKITKNKMFRKAQEIWKNFDQEVLSKDQPDETYNKHGKAEFGDKTFDFKG